MSVMELAPSTSVLIVSTEPFWSKKYHTSLMLAETAGKPQSASPAPLAVAQVLSPIRQWLAPFVSSIAFAQSLFDGFGVTVMATFPHPTDQQPPLAEL